jgi:diguanylate cyclase (GGDEF)-like protein
VALDLASGRPRRRIGWRRVAPVLAGTALVVYLALLLATTHLAQERLRESAQARHALELRLRAAALSYFYAERRGDLLNLARSQPVSAFFANRDLGMSMEYGLRASLQAIRALAQRLTEEARVGGAPVYRRIALFDSDGAPLLDTSKDPPTVTRWKPAVAGPGQSVLVKGPVDYPGAVLLETPVHYRGRMRGTLVAWVDEAAALAALVGSDPAADGISHYRVLRPDEGVAPASAAEGPVPVEGTGLRLLAYPDRADASTTLTSPWFLGTLVTLAVGLIAIGGLLLRAQQRNLVLEARMEAARLQRRKLAQHNERLMCEIAKREESERRLVYQVNYDTLTGLPNRVLAMDRIEQSLGGAARDARTVLLLYVDIDRFKRVNESLGHSAGDQVLVQAAARLGTLIGPGDTLARIAADELVLLFPDRIPGERAEIQARKVLRLFARPFVVDGRELFLGASIGIALYPRDGRDAERLLKHADLAMKQAKDQGRGRYCTYTPGLDQRVREDLAIANLLRRALGRGELNLVYQPLVEIDSRRTVAVEALLRWDSDELGTVSPSRFIPIAEDAGLIDDLGAWVLDRACAAAAGWQGGAPCRLAVNVSPLQLQTPASFRRSVCRALERSGLAPELLELEITERVLLRDQPKISGLLADLNRVGVRLSIDDFGTGYSTLSYLRRFPFQMLKIDRSFILGIPENLEDTELTRAIVAMAHALGLTVVAEGVEREEQLGFLSALGCDLAQGFLLSDALDAGEIGEFLYRGGATELRPA